MDKEIPLACGEEKRHPMLLAYAGSGEIITTSSRGEEGKESNSDAEGDEGGKVKMPPKKSKGVAKAKRGDGKRKPETGFTYSFRDTVREVERTHRASRRSAEELGISYPDSECNENPYSKAHYWVDELKTTGGSVFVCKYCFFFKWLPSNHDDAQNMGSKMKMKGNTVGYQFMLDNYPKAKMLIAKLQDISKLRGQMTLNRYAIVLRAVMKEEK